MIRDGFDTDLLVTARPEFSKLGGGVLHGMMQKGRFVLRSVQNPNLKSPFFFLVKIILY